MSSALEEAAEEVGRMGNVPLLSKGYVTQRDGIVCVYHNFCLFFKDLLAVWILSDEVDIDTGPVAGKKGPPAN